MALVIGGAAGCSRARQITLGVPWYPLSGPLIPAWMTMVTEWDIKKNRQAGRPITLADRIVDCFLRSEKATGLTDAGAVVSSTDKQVLAVSAYLAWHFPWLQRGTKSLMAESERHPDSWDDGAGAARVYTLAGIIGYMMTYLDPGN